MIKKTFWFLLFVQLVLGDSNYSCNLRSVSNGTICVCNSTYCDTVPEIVDLSPGQYQLYTTSPENLGFSSTTEKFLVTSKKSSTTITVNVSVQYQTIIGFGGAFTDSTGQNILDLPDDAQEKLLESYFGEDGIGYSLGRVPIGGTDFSPRGYSLCNVEDPTLGNFSLQMEDLTYKIPIIQKALHLRGNESLKLFASAWSAPDWMKTNGALSGFGWLKEEYYQLYAEYLIKFLDAYAYQEIPFWGMTTQNEPIDGFVPSKLNSMGWLPSWMNNWVGTNLGPTIRNSTYKDLKIIMHDDIRILLPIFKWFVLSNETTLKYADGIAVHWYTDFFTPKEVLNFARTDKKDLFLIGSEACNGFLQAVHLEEAVLLGSWQRAEKYMKNILDDLEYGAGGWTDWNMVLNTAGGPCYIKNNVDAPVIVNATAGEFYKQPMYYIMGHFSKFIVPDSVRLETNVDLDGGKGEEVRSMAFLRPDKKVAVIIWNSKSSPEEVTIDISGSTTTLTIDGNSVNTLLHNAS